MKRIHLNNRTRLIGAFVVVAIFPLIILGLVNNATNREALINGANQSLYAVALQTASSLDTFISNNLLSIKTESALPLLPDLLEMDKGSRHGSQQETAVIELLQALAEKSPHITSYALLDAAGVPVVDTDPNGIMTNKADRSYFQHFMMNPNETAYVSPVRFSEQTGEASLYFSSPVRNESENMIGLLRVRYNASVLQELLEAKNDLAGQGSFGVLFDEYHLHLAHGTAPEVNFLPITQLDETTIAQLEAENRLPNLSAEVLYQLDLQELEEHLSNPERDRFFEAEDVATGDLINQVAIAQMETQPWLITFFQPQEIFLAPVQNQTRAALIIIFFISGGALLVAFLVGRALGQPIQALSQTVMRFSDGDLSARSDLNSQDEIGTLARTYNTMAQRLETVLTDLRRLSAVIETTSDFVGIATLDNRLLYVNPAGMRMIGQEDATADSLTEQDFLMSDELERMQNIIMPVVMETGVWEGEVMWRRQNKVPFPVSQVITLIHDDDDNPIAIGTIARDITPMRAAQEAIQASEERYRITSELTNDYIYSVRVDKNKDFTLEWATDAFERLTGYSPAELAEQGGWGSIVHPDDTETYNQARAELLATGKSDVVEYRILTKSGETRWLRDHRAPKWDDAAGRVVSLLGASYDVTTRIESQLELQKLASIVENSNDAIFSASLDGIVQSWNPAAQAMFGYTAAEAIGQTMTELIARDRADEALNMYEMVADGQNIDSKETLRITKDGRSIEIAATLSPIRDEKGEVTAVSAILRDITVQKHAERELHKAKNEAEAANHAKSAFLANMSHELRTPLNAILGFTQLIARDQTLPPEQEEHLSIISRSGEHLLALINDILEVSKIEAGRTKVTTTAFDLHKLLEDLENMFTLKAERKKIRLLFEQDPTTPHYIQADESKIRQVLINLINNAIKFTHEGGVTVRIRGRGKQDPNLCLEIQDTGAGIEPEALDTLFDAFTQSQTGQKSQEGTGLGLSISQQFVQLMGGDLRVESEPGTGSIFSFEIPIQFAAFEDIADTTPSRRVIGVKPGQPTQRLLIVEDRVENRKLLTSLLRPFGFELREAVNGKEALEVWEDWEPNLIWMDMRMPVMDGYETTRRIKSTTKGQSTVIIAITASAFEEDRDTILSAGSDDFVRKPFRENEIFDMLAKHLDVQFEYEEFAAATDEGMFIRDVPTQIIRTIPRNLLTSIHNATIEADIDLVMAIIEEIRAHNPDVAHALTDLARNFQYDTLIDLTQPE